MRFLPRMLRFAAAWHAFLHQPRPANSDQGSVVNAIEYVKKRLSIAIGLTLACALPALAQSDKPAEKKDPGAVTTMDNVTVSASRIDRPGFVSPTPTVQITPEELDMVARPNVAAALNDMPQFRATTSAQTTGTNTSAGQAPVDLRGLGTSRTLVLMEGRRFVSDNDLNTVPGILIRDVDIVTGGASAAWGSGAVGGVVNIAIDEDLQGAKFDLHGGQSSYSDAEQRAMAFAFGTGFAEGRGHLVVGAEYSDHEGIIPKTSRPDVGRWAQVSNGDGSYTTVADVGILQCSLWWPDHVRRAERQGVQSRWLATRL